MDRRNFLRLGAGVLGAGVLSDSRAKAQQQGKPMNVLLILTDDHDPQTAARMDRMKNVMGNGGTRFPRGAVTTPLCGPSRATILTGRYAHNHGCLDHFGDKQTWGQYRDRGHEEDSLPVWLRNAGVTTALMGKYLNGYGRFGDDLHVPPGWKTWVGWQGSYAEYGDDEYRVNGNGRILSFSRSKIHDTDWFTRRAKTFIRNRAGEEAPWFLMVALNGPHSPSYAAERHRDLYTKARMPKPESFNEADVSDKPAYIRARKMLDAAGIAEVEAEYRQRLRAQESIDDLIADLVIAVRESGQEGETVVVFTADNGFSYYRHRISTKGAPYRESIGVPFYVRGPGVPAGALLRHLVSNVDLAPSILEWTGVPQPHDLDGRSLVPLLRDPTTAPWRRRQLLERSYLAADNAGWRGVRTADQRLYVEYEAGDREYYEADLWELDSEHEKSENDAETTELAGHLALMKACAGDSCRTAEDAP